MLDYYLHQLRKRVFWSILLLPLSFTSAQVMSGTVGELVTTKQVTVNGETAISGQTLCNENTIKTSRPGVAIISLRADGQIKLEAETDFTLRLAAHSVGGELRAGRAVFNVPANVLVIIKAAGCQIETEAGLSSSLSVGIEKERLVVAAHQGAAKFTCAGKTELIANGEEVWTSLSSWKWQRQEISYPTVSKGTTQSATLLNLLGISFMESFRHLIASFSAPPIYYETTLTCRDLDSLHCHSNGGVKP